MTLFERFERHKNLYLFLLVVGYLLINNSINATSEWMEALRHGTPEILLIEPFVWEYSSAIGVLVLLPLLSKLWTHFPVKLTRIKHQIIIHLVASLVFSILHISIMVALRELAYWTYNSDYHFGPIFREFLYEYRKDLWGYLFFLGLFQLYQFIYSRLKGEANLISQESEKVVETVPEHFLVKKLDREFLIKVNDIEWMESAGNYVNLYSKGRVYPLRSTLSQISQRLLTKGFCRTHRSYAVNSQFIDHINYQASGDGDIHLTDGQIVSISRRYKEEFKKVLS
ncbi:LytR/AlgR family response regulator transcription factor [Paraglaciecola sp.]|uniref:LytR/AlgR family response regulator transcription factor n=1 Tax=Paraglaciecola sp. TaxID=1920173 RepID=UPI003EF97DE0